MDIKLFSLCNQDSQEAESGKQKTLSCVKDYFPECNGFSDFTSQKRMLVAISKSLLAADIVLVAVQSTMYNATKRLLCAALDIKTEENAEVASRLKNRLDAKKIKPNIYTANITYPEGATVLPTDDYINCGFTLTSGGQHIIYMPVEDEKAQQVLLGSLYDYFAQLSEPLVAANALKNRHRALIARTVSKLGKDSVRVAVAGNDASDYLTAFLTKKESSVFVVDMNYELPQDGDIKTHAIEAARAVRDNNHTQLGAYISDPFSLSDGDALCVCIAVANEEGTKTYTVSVEDGESEKEFTRVCVDKLLSVLCDYERIGNTQEESAAEKEADNNLKGILGIIASAAVLAASIAGFVTALIMR